MDRPTCATCAYFDSAPTLDADGTCHRRAPCSDEACEVATSYWCGEHPDFAAYLARKDETQRPLDDCQGKTRGAKGQILPSIGAWPGDETGEQISRALEGVE